MAALPISLSIIVPVLNEAPLIGNFLKHLRVVAPQAELIVVDGGSVDGTCSIASPLADLVIQSSPGRAVQMNAGAAAAHGHVLWFLHADLKVPSNSVQIIERALVDPRVIGGCFRIRYPQPNPIYRIGDSLGNLGVDVFGFALGDHGIFCRRGEFERIGGYPRVPILEDAELYRALHRIGRMKQKREEIISNPRTFEKHGRYRTTAVYSLILVLYVLGLPISQLNRIYRWFRGASRRFGAASQLAQPAR
ncbi:MAG: TIGR04283 family arsenosugar biosynthesis glycosyltransferase [Chthoniobacterales bacterium]